MSSKSVKLCEYDIPTGTMSGTGKIVVTDADTIKEFQRRDPNYTGSACILNFANNDIAGGGYGLTGNTQEEALMKDTSLAIDLSFEFYPIDTVVDCGRYWNYRELALIYSKNVTINGVAKTPHCIPTITCAAIKCPRQTMDGKYERAENREITLRKIGMILDCAAMFGHNVLIAGAWGCGAFVNPPEIYELWRKEIVRRDLLVVFPMFGAKTPAAFLNL